MKFKQITPWGKYLAAVTEDGAFILVEVVTPGMAPVAPILVTHQIHFQPTQPQQNAPSAVPPPFKAY